MRNRKGKLMSERKTGDCNVQKEKKKTFLFIFELFISAFITDDAVYLEDEDLRREFVLNESGKVWMGSARRPDGKRWIFGQFDDVVLPAIMYLLELSKLNHADRGNVVHMVRAISAVVRSDM
jgi:transglutaminase 1